MNVFKKFLLRYMSKWAQLDIDDKIAVVDSLIKVIRAGENTLEIEWKI